MLHSHFQFQKARRWAAVALMTAVSALGCETEPAAPAVPKWQIVFQELPGALFSVWGSGPSDVWMVGARDPSKVGSNPTVLRWNGKAWSRVQVAAPGIDLWWVSGAPDGDVWMAGTGGTIARWRKSTGTTEVLPTPGTSHLFGIFPVSATEAWAVGGSNGGPGVVWRWDGKTWSHADVPAALISQTTQWFKAFKHQGILWIVGLDGKLLRFDGTTWTSPPSGIERTLLTVHCAGSLCAAVGGSNTGDIVELQGGTWKKVTPGKVPQFNGVFLRPDGSGMAVGANGNIYARSTAGQWSPVTAAPEALEDYHAVWLDSSGSAWAVGGQLLGSPQVLGQVVHFGPAKVSTVVPAE